MNSQGKPLSPPKFAPVDWHTSNLFMFSSAERQRGVSHDIRQLSHTTRNITDNHTRWTQHGTDSELAHRIKDINDWKFSLIATLQNVEAEINKLTEHKQLLEKALEAKNMPLEVVLACLSEREHRVSIDLVRDEVELELKKELEVIEGIRSALHLKIQAAFKQLCVLQDCHRQLTDDLQDKDYALNIDGTCAELSNEDASKIALQDDPTRIKRGIVTPQQWSSFSAHNRVTSETEIQNSMRLREQMSETVRQTNADLEAQWNTTHYAFRKRKHEVEQTKKELEWQKKSTEKEIEDLTGEIDNLEMAKAAKNPPMMVVQTRLENRTQRPNVELCRDQPQYDMVEEIAQIQDSVYTLQNKLDMARETLGTLQRTLERINEDIMIKTNSLDLDDQCMQIRQKLAEHPNLL